MTLNSFYQAIIPLRKICTLMVLTGVFCSVFICAESHAQETDTTAVQAESKLHSPNKATIYSAILPGMGQAYNNKYWKIPIIYGAGGAFAYFISYHHNKYKKFRDAYVDGIPGEPVLIDGRLYDYDDLPRGRDFYRRYRDLNLLGFGVIYFLNIIDAMIDAHFFYYDVSDDLSFSIEPVMMNEVAAPSAIGIKFHIGF